MQIHAHAGQTERREVKRWGCRQHREQLTHCSDDSCRKKPKDKRRREVKQGQKLSNAAAKKPPPTPAHSTFFSYFLWTKQLMNEVWAMEASSAALHCVCLGTLTPYLCDTLVFACNYMCMGCCLVILSPPRSLHFSDLIGFHSSTNLDTIWYVAGLSGLRKCYKW